MLATPSMWSIAPPRTRGFSTKSVGGGHRRPLRGMSQKGRIHPFPGPSAKHCQTRPPYEASRRATIQRPGYLPLDRGLWRGLQPAAVALARALSAPPRPVSAPALALTPAADPSGRRPDHGTRAWYDVQVADGSVFAAASSRAKSIEFGDAGLRISPRVFPTAPLQQIQYCAGQPGFCPEIWLVHPDFEEPRFDLPPTQPNDSQLLSLEVRQIRFEASEVYHP